MKTRLSMFRVHYLIRMTLSSTEETPASIRWLASSLRTSSTNTIRSRNFNRFSVEIWTRSRTFAIRPGYSMGPHMLRCAKVASWAGVPLQILKAARPGSSSWTAEWACCSLRLSCQDVQSSRFRTIARRRPLLNRLKNWLLTVKIRTIFAFWG